MPCRRGVTRDPKRLAHGDRHPFERQREPDQHDAPERDPPPGQHVGHAGRPGHPETLAGQIDRRIPALEPDPINPNELGHRLGITPGLVELGAVLLPGDPAVPGPDRIDEHQVGPVEPGLLVVHQPARVGKPPGPQPAHLDQAGVRSGPAVPGECHRAIGTSWLQRIGDEEDPCVRLAGFVVPDREPADGGGIAESAAVDHDLMMGHHQRLERGRRRFVRQLKQRDRQGEREHGMP